MFSTDCVLSFCPGKQFPRCNALKEVSGEPSCKYCTFTITFYKAFLAFSFSTCFKHMFSVRVVIRTHMYCLTTLKNVNTNSLLTVYETCTLYRVQQFWPWQNWASQTINGYLILLIGLTYKINFPFFATFSTDSKSA